MIARRCKGLSAARGWAARGWAASWAARGRAARGSATFAVAIVLLAGCGSAGTNGGGTTGGSTGSPTASAKPAVCSSVQKLTDDVVGLKDVNIRENGTSAVSDQLTKIQQQLNVVKSDSHGQFSTQIDDLSNALSGLRSSATAAKDSPSTGTISALASAAGKVVSTGNSLVTAVSHTC
jgi:hypothetical protein